MKMKPIVDQLPKDQILAELTKDKLLRKTNNGNNEVYIFDGPSSPALMHEVGRVREITFRYAGGGTGKEIDIDEYDINPDCPHTQLIVWDPENDEIVGGYRVFYHKDPNKTYDISNLASSAYFIFSDKFLTRYFPYMMELGRSFVHPDYQSRTRGRKSLYALDNLWDGLGALFIENPRIKYLFGKVTMYPQFNQKARNMIIYFLRKHFNDPDNLINPIGPAIINLDEDEMKLLFKSRRYRHNYQGLFRIKSYKSDYKVLSQEVRKLNETIPPLINAYMNLSPTMRTFGTFINHKFGDVEETGIMITLRDIYVEKINRHLASYNKDYEIDWFSHENQ
jgi:GNAT superfamily N-acetyltransferase